MRIFDGVEVTPPPNSTMQNVLSIAMLIANSYVEADKYRRERVASENKGSPETLEEVMAQAGLKIPGLEEAIARLVGSEEGKRVASMIVNSPDPVSLLRAVAMQFGQSDAGVEPPSAGPTPEASPQGHPAPAANPRRAAHAPPPAPLAKFRPEFTPDAPKRSAQPPQTTLVGVVRQQLQALRARMNAHAERMNERLTRAEAQVAEMQHQLEQQRRSRPALVVVPHADEPPKDLPAAPIEAATPSPVASPESTPTAQLGDVAPRILEDLGVVPVEAPLPAAAEQEVVEAMELIAELTAEVETRQQQETERVEALELHVQRVQATIAMQAPDPAAANA